MNSREYNRRPFVRYMVHIHVFESVGLTTHDFFTSTEIICAYCLPALRINCRINEFLPTKYCRADIEFIELESGISIEDAHGRYRLLWSANYSDIRSRIVRNIIFCLTINHLSLYENCL